MKKSQPQPQTVTPPENVTPTDSQLSTPDLLARLRAARSLDDAVQILTPDSKPKASADTLYEVNPASVAPLPQRRGLSVLVYATAARMEKPFTIGDIQAALPDQKSVRYWVRTLAKVGWFVEVSS